MSSQKKLFPISKDKDIANVRKRILEMLSETRDIGKIIL